MPTSLPLFDFFRTLRRPAPAALARVGIEPYTLDVEGGIQARVQRKRMRTLRMTVKPPDGALQVSAPLRVSDQAIRQFILQRRAWIEAQRARLARQAAAPVARYEDGETLPLLGRSVRLTVLHQGVTSRCRFDGHTLTLKAPATASRVRREAAVKRWYAAELLKAAEALAPALQASMGVKAQSFRVRAMRSRWGSCDTRKAVITLGLELARRPPEALEYILVHELAHLRVRSHGPRFKAILDAQMPDWRQRRQRLNLGAWEE